MIRISLFIAALLGLSISVNAQVLKTSPINPGSKLLKDGDVVEVFVDEKGKIYRELRYHGIVPSIRDSLTPPGKNKKRGKKAQITWVGFQPKEFYSRIFVQADRVTRFALHKPDPMHIAVTFPNARIPRKNNRRPIRTSQFASKVAGIEAFQRGKNVVVVISLRKPAGYLYKRKGNYVFIDVER